MSFTDLLSIIISRSIHIAANDFISFFLWLIFHSMYVYICMRVGIYMYIIYVCVCVCV